MKVALNVEYNGSKTDCKHLVERVKEVWREDGNKMKEIENLEVYFKPQESTCYYVINGKISGSFVIRN